MSAEFERLLAQFEEFQSKIQRIDDRFGSLESMQAEVAGIEAAATSSDGNITVTAGPGGAVTDIRFTEGALKQRPETLASTVLSTLQQAVADAARQQATAVDTHMGSGGLDVTDQVLETQAQLFGTSTAQLRSQLQESAPAPSRPPEDDIHDDYSQRSVLESGDPPQRTSPPSAQRDEPLSAGEEFLRNLFDDDGYGDSRR